MTVRGRFALGSFPLALCLFVLAADSFRTHRSGRNTARLLASRIPRCLTP